MHDLRDFHGGARCIETGEELRTSWIRDRWVVAPRDGHRTGGIQIGEVVDAGSGLSVECSITLINRKS